eukprot:279389_1
MGNKISQHKTSKGLQIDELKIFQQLINMSFDEQLSLRAVHKFGSDINKCINYINKYSATKSTTTKSMQHDEKAQLPPSTNNIQYNNDIAHNIVKGHKSLINYAPCKIDDCAALQRILKHIKFYQPHKKFDDKLSKYLMKHKNAINDYHHILDVHLNIDDDMQFKLIYDKMIKDEQLRCDINKCSIYKRNNRERENEKIKCDENIMVYVDIMDSIHCYFLHSIDTGFRIFNNNDYDAKSMKSYLLGKRKNLERIRGNARVSKFKFMTDTATSKESKTESNVDTNDSQYRFGERINYWNEWFYNEKHRNQKFTKLKKKYDSLKQELLDNNIFSIDADIFESAFKKATHLLCNSDKIKSVTSGSNEYYGVISWCKLQNENILSIILYTDYDTLSYNFSSTFRQISTLKCSVRERNREYWHWSKLLIETVNCYGSDINVSSKSGQVFYHGVSQMYFPHFIACFYSPTSTTTKIQIAAIFSKNDGLILQLKEYGHLTHLSYFNCSFISCFSNENERLFVGGSGYLQFHSIHDMATGESYQQFVKAITSLETCMSGRLNNEIVGFMYKCDTCGCKSKNVSRCPDSFRYDTLICHKTMNKPMNHPMILVKKLIATHTFDHPTNDTLVCNLIGGDNSYSNYIIKCFQNWCLAKKNITLNLADMMYFFPKLLSIITHSSIHNLLLLDKINGIFKNARNISCTEVGKIDHQFLKCLVSIMIKINQMKFSNLYEVELRNVKTFDLYEVKCVKDKTFEKYKSILKDNNWKLAPHFHGLLISRINYMEIV